MIKRITSRLHSVSLSGVRSTSTMNRSVNTSLWELNECTLSPSPIILGVKQNLILSVQRRLAGIFWLEAYYLHARLGSVETNDIFAVNLTQKTKSRILKLRVPLVNFLRPKGRFFYMRWRQNPCHCDRLHDNLLLMIIWWYAKSPGTTRLLMVHNFFMQVYY